MKIMYIHGFGSQFDPNHPKIRTLIKHLPQYLVDEDQPVEVVGVDIDYSVDNPIMRVMTSNDFPDTDLVIGTSMGGWTASHVGSMSGLPWVAINPAIEPEQSLEPHLMKPGEEPKTDFTGRKIKLTRRHLHLCYEPKMRTRGGLILLDIGDELFDYKKTLDYVDDRMPVAVFDGGSHQFDHMKEACPYIGSFWNLSVCHGIG